MLNKFYGWKNTLGFSTLFLIVLSLQNIALGNECLRPCIAEESPMTCHYTFHIEYYATLTKACWDCPNNITDCSRHHCIAADGVHKGLVTINRQFPGPSIQVCEGDEVVVDVINHLPSESTSIHWHGQHMVGTPYMDGVPLLTQCPIGPASSFRYRFWAANAGTNYYHSHSGFQRADGVAGSFIVRQAATRDIHARHYDHDLPEHVIFVSDWLHEMGLTKFVSHHHDDGDNKSPNILVNGMGRFSKDEEKTDTPLASFNITQGYRYRFRLISNSILNCPIQMSIDNHTMKVLASDGYPIVPIEVDAITIAAGERYDFVINANQTPDNYWIRFHGLIDCAPLKAHQVAILHYEMADFDEPEGLVNYENCYVDGKVLNPVNVAPGTEDDITVAELNSTSKADENWNKEPDVKIWLAYDFYEVNNLHFHDPEHYPIFLVPHRRKLFTPQLNRISLKMPPVPPLSQPSDVPYERFCNTTTVGDCKNEFCECIYVEHVPLGSLVEMIIIDEGNTFDATHPFHLHGSAFRVLAMERLGNVTTLDDVLALDAAGKIERKFSAAPIKDTVSVPDGGYAVVRFIADNPGYWLFHCHLSFHVEVGMGLIFKVGEQEDFPPVPRNFPTCGPWLLNREDADLPPRSTSAIVFEEETTTSVSSTNDESNVVDLNINVLDLVQELSNKFKSSAVATAPTILVFSVVLFLSF
ncbi:uncharacterized protein LOC136031488 isoform X1 [Artemia franciscana]|uniref:uncharacterized protein LOC136031488 isoform X1 n=2 Tax=Artemia franciscana TaxID=6661 RepID=UPI0032DB4B02